MSDGPDMSGSTTMTCPECDRTFAGRRGWTTHRRNAHGYRVPAGEKRRGGYPNTPEGRARRSEWQRAWRQTPKGRLAAIRSARRRYENRNSPSRTEAQAKERARKALREAVRRGSIQKRPCADCGAAPTEGHHYDGYEGASRYKVVWLCKPCHLALHRVAA